jgi:hypothetical protein
MALAQQKRTVTGGLKGQYNLAQGNALGFDEPPKIYRRPERAI